MVALLASKQKGGVWATPHALQKRGIFMSFLLVGRGAVFERQKSRFSNPAIRSGRQKASLKSPKYRAQRGSTRRRFFLYFIKKVMLFVRHFFVEKKQVHESATWGWASNEVGFNCSKSSFGRRTLCEKNRIGRPLGGDYVECKKIYSFGIHLCRRMR